MNIVVQCPNPWKDFTAHFTKNKKVKRCKIGNWNFSPFAIGMDVVFEVDGQTKQKTLSPITLAAYNVMWSLNTVVSDDEDNDNIDVPLGNLPKIKLSMTDTFFLKDQDQRQALMWTIEQANGFLDITI